MSRPAMNWIPGMVMRLRRGWIDSIVVQNPFRMGYEATRAVG